jgi:hypothetical protein
LKYWSPTKKQKIIGLVVLILLVAGGTTAALTLRKKPAPLIVPVVQKVEEKVEAPKPTTEASRLTGVQVSPELNKLPVTAVMIENSPDARPQSGLKDAGVVFEAITEGGITRFMALFQTEQPDYIGPVRSVRPQFLDFLAPFDAGIAHAGGSGPALAQIKAEGFKDLDQFANAGAYHRVDSRFAPHNLYTSRKQLLDLQNAKGWSTSTFTGFPRKEENKTPSPSVTSIDVTISSMLYNPHFDYDVASNSYLRSEGGKPQLDEKSGAQLSPKVVVVLIMPHHYEGIYSVYQDTGSGQAFVFQDGSMTNATWNKANRKDQLKLTDSTGAPLKLNPGQTWFTLASLAGSVTYK